MFVWWVDGGDKVCVGRLYPCGGWMVVIRFVWAGHVMDCSLTVINNSYTASDLFLSLRR